MINFTIRQHMLWLAINLNKELAMIATSAGGCFWCLEGFKKQ